jgi:hypothetical protein
VEIPAVDHIGGLRALAAVGATIVVGQGDGAFRRKVLSAPGRSIPMGPSSRRRTVLTRSRPTRRPGTIPSPTPNPERPCTSRMIEGAARGDALANKGHDTRAIQGWLSHRSITSTTVYTGLPEQS